MGIIETLLHGLDAVFTYTSTDAGKSVLLAIATVFCIICGIMHVKERVCQK